MKDILSKKIGLAVLENEPLKNHTTFKIGGPAKFFVSVNNKADLLKSLAAAKDLSLPYYILGGGSNVLVSDKGFDGLVIRLADGEPDFNGESVRVFSGHSWSGFVRETMERGLSGLEFGASIPGTVGGAVYGNAGAYGQSAGDFIESAEVIIDAGELGLKNLSREDCEFSYRESVFKKNKNWIISEVVFKLKKDDGASQRLKQIQSEYNGRSAKQPLNYPSAGCSFKNILYTDELLRFKDWQVNGKLPAARFIEEADLKGCKIGGAMVSDKHANFIVNVINAKADDVVQLISLVKTKVRNEFGVQLSEEIQYVGF